MDKVRIGIVGTSWFADIAHLPIYDALPDAEVVSICGRNEERAREMAAKYSIPNVYSDYRRLVEGREIDGVVIVTPDDLHHPIAMLALDAGLHVFCEKPLAYTLNEAQQMRDAAKSAKVITLVNHTYRWMPVYRFAHKLVADGAVGQIYRGMFSYAGGYGRVKSDAWRYDAARCNGVLGDLGSHMIDMARFLVGDMTEVSARLDVGIPHSGGVKLEAPNDIAALLVAFDTGAVGQIIATKIDHREGQLQVVELHGSDASIYVEFTLNDARIRRVWGAENNEEVLEIPPELGGYLTRDGFPAYFINNDIGPRLFVRSILGTADPSPTFEDGLRVQEVIDAACRSSEEGTRVRL